MADQKPKQPMKRNQPKAGSAKPSAITAPAAKAPAPIAAAKPAPVKPSAPDVPAKSAPAAVTPQPPFAAPAEATPVQPQGDTALVSIAVAEAAAAKVAIAAAPVKHNIQIETQGADTMTNETIDRVQQAQNESIDRVKQAQTETIDRVRQTQNVAAERFQAVVSDANERTKTAVEKGTKLMEEMSDITRGNVEALVASSRVAAKGVETLGQEAADFGRRSFEEASAALKSFAEVRSPTDLFRLQSDYARAAFDAMIAESSKVSEHMIKLAGEVAEPITSRYSDNAQRVKNVAL